MAPATTLLALQRTIQQRKEDSSGAHASCHRAPQAIECSSVRLLDRIPPTQPMLSVENVCGRWETFMDGKAAEQPRALVPKGEGGGRRAMSNTGGG